MPRSSMTMKTMFGGLPEVVVTMATRSRASVATLLVMA